jgi:hypothetical protein
MFSRAISTDVFRRTQAKISEKIPALPCIKKSAHCNLGPSRLLWRSVQRAIFIRPGTDDSLTARSHLRRRINLLPPAAKASFNMMWIVPLATSAESTADHRIIIQRKSHPLIHSKESLFGEQCLDRYSAHSQSNRWTEKFAHFEYVNGCYIQFVLCQQASQFQCLFLHLKNEDWF